MRPPVIVSPSWDNDVVSLRVIIQYAARVQTVASQCALSPNGEMVGQEGEFIEYEPGFLQSRYFIKLPVRDQYPDTGNDFSQKDKKNIAKRFQIIPSSS